MFKITSGILQLKMFSSKNNNWNCIQFISTFFLPIMSAHFYEQIKVALIEVT